jgi:hypothetical protein
MWLIGQGFVAAVTMTVASAWACVLWAPFGPPVVREGQCDWPRRVPDDWPPTSTGLLTATSFGLTTVTGIASDGAGVGQSMNHLAAGFPWRAMAMDEFIAIRPGSMSTEYTGLSGVPRWIPRADPPLRRNHLPIQPMWAGFAANTALNLGVVGLLWYGLRSLIRLRRIRAGRCAACGYSLAGLAPAAPCPECGRAHGG